MKLSATEIDLITLLKRSKHDDDGFYQVSGDLWPLYLRMPAQLVELKEAGDKKFVKLSRDGEIVFYWLL